MPASITTSTSSVSLRLFWRLRAADSGVSLQPCVQSGEMPGRGRAVPLARLMADEDRLAPQDVLVVRALRPLFAQAEGDAARIDAISVLPLLVGHPAVFMADAPGTRVAILAGEVSLDVCREGAEIVLQLVPKGIAAASSVFWTRPEPGCLRVYRVDAEIRQIAALLGHALRLPHGARRRILEAIHDIAPWLPVHDVSPVFDDTQPYREGDARLHALLVSRDDGLRVQFKVRPHAASAWYAPGSGKPGLVLAEEGDWVQVRRDLAAERQHWRAVQQACPALEAAVRDADAWLLSDRQSGLDLLVQLQAMGEAGPVCLWPEGERMRIRGACDAAPVRIKVRRKGGWLEASGEVELDDGRIVQLRQLLEALAARPGRYLPLSGEDWLVLGAALTERLRQLASLVDHFGPDGVCISPLAAPRLAALADDCTQVEGDAGWQQVLQKLQDAAAFDPEVPAGLQAVLRPYQLEGFRWMARLASWGMGACLADDMGLGKTVQTLALLLMRAPRGPQLVVAPTSVALNWLSEAARFAPSLRLLPYHVCRRLDDLGPGDLVVCSYGLLQREAEAFGAVHWTSIVLDEAQAIKNPASQRAGVVQSLRADFRLAASGTPIENHLGELWSLFRFVTPGLLGTQVQFEQRFAGPVGKGDDASRDALRALIRPYILRRTKAEVLTELPPRTELLRLVTLSDAERHVYEAMRQEALDKVDGADPAEGGTMRVLAELTRLRRFCCHPGLVQSGSALPASKLQAFLLLCRELLDNGHKALVFSQFVDHLAIIARELEALGVRFHYLDGATPLRQRKAAMDAFQSGDGDLFLISLKAGGTGLNLTAADYVIHLDPWWNPAVEDQASDRAYRMGQQRPVTIYRLVAADTIEERIVALHAEKRALADSLLAGSGASAALDAEALLALLRAQ